MDGWIETCRGIVFPWECDGTEHFTIAYYFDRFDDATAAIAETLGLTELERSTATRRFDVRFARELRAGDGFHVASAPIAVDERTIRLGHRVVDSATAETVTWVEQSFDLAAAPPPGALRDAIGARLARWEGPPVEPRPEPRTTEGFIPTSRGLTRPGDLDAHGRFTLAAFVHRFSAACLQAMAAIGMTTPYMEAERRGLSTFELGLRIGDWPLLGDPVLTETGIMHLGNSSVRFVHRMCDPRSGQEYARMGQFGVLLDLDARRPARLPDEFRSRAARLLVAPA